MISTRQMRSKRVWSLITSFIIALVLFMSISPALAQAAESPQLAPPNPELEAFWEQPPEPFYGYIPPPVDLSHLKRIPVEKPVVAFAPLPDRFDWREQGKVTPVRDQGICGTCWIHGTLAAIESRVLVVDSEAYDFSEQNVACCTDPSWVYLQNNRCGGGGGSWLATDVLTKKGTRLESCDPYNTSTIDSDTCNDACDTIKRVTGYRLVGYSVSLPGMTDDIKSAIYNYGPVSMAYHHDSDPSRWNGNIYYYPDCVQSPNHLICIVGWDDTVPHPEGGGSGVWIVKNSWGTGFGDGGYFYLCYGSANMQEVASYRYEDYDPDEVVHYWDEAGWLVNVGYGDSSAWMASIFTPEQDGMLTNVDFWTTSNNAQYEICVYNGSFGSQLAYQSGTCAECGYYSIPLGSPIPLSSGQQFTVAVKLITPDYGYPIPVETEWPGMCDPPIQSEVCFMRHGDSDIWQDVADYGYNVCLRAKVQAAAPPAPPTVTTNDASDIGTDSATLNGNLDDLGTATIVDVSFEWGTTPGGPYPNETTPQAISATGPFSFDLNGLAAGTTYYVKAKAVGDGTTSYGAEKSFTTLSTPPTVTTNDASDIGTDSATLNGNLDDLGTAATVDVSFEWGTTPGGPYPNETTPQAKSATGPFTSDLNGLAAGTTYYIKAKAVGHGTSYGEEKSFTTESCTSLFEDPVRGTRLCIDANNKTFRFTAPDYDSGVLYAPNMIVRDGCTAIWYAETESIYFLCYANALKKACFGLLYDTDVGVPYLIMVAGELGEGEQPAMFYGAAEADGANVPEGTEITASIEGAGSWNATATGDEKLGYCLVIPADNSATPELDGAREGDTVSFKIGNATAAQTCPWISSIIQQLSLSEVPEEE